MRKVFYYFTALAVAVGSSVAASAADPPIPTAVRFPVIFKTAVSTRAAKTGDVIEAVLKDDLRVDDQIVATAGSMLVGHIEEVDGKTESGKRSIISIETRLRGGNKKAFRLLFDEIVTAENEFINIVGVASKQKIEVLTNGSTREITVSNYGELESSDRFIHSGRKLIAAAIQRGIKQESGSSKHVIADIESGDVLLVQAHSPYNVPTASAQ